ncbi:4055_t:CDS:2, partial [Entrophospora sp. SA101]
MALNNNNDNVLSINNTHYNSLSNYNISTGNNNIINLNDNSGSNNYDSDNNVIGEENKTNDKLIIDFDFNFDNLDSNSQGKKRIVNEERIVMSKLESSIKTTSTNEKSPNYQMRLFIVGEIYSTELSYLKHLKKLRKVKASKTPNPLVNPKLIPTIFAYIDDLIKLSNELVKSMRFSPFPSSNNLQYIYNNHRLGQTFLRYYKDFDIYQKYAKNHRKSRNAIKKANKNVLYRKFVQEHDAIRLEIYPEKKTRFRYLKTGSTNLNAGLKPVAIISTEYFKNK